MLGPLVTEGPPDTESRQPRDPGHRREHAGQATFVPAGEDLPDPLVSAFFSDLAAVPDDPASELDVFVSVPEDFSLAAELSAEAPFGDLDPLTEELRLSVR